jgi:hypothetical protein
MEEKVKKKALHDSTSMSSLPLSQPQPSVPKPIIDDFTTDAAANNTDMTDARDSLCWDNPNTITHGIMIETTINNVVPSTLLSIDGTEQPRLSSSDDNPTTQTTTTVVHSAEILVPEVVLGVVPDVFSVVQPDAVPGVLPRLSHSVPVLTHSVLHATSPEKPNVLPSQQSPNNIEFIAVHSPTTAKNLNKKGSRGRKQ